MTISDENRSLLRERVPESIAKDGDYVGWRPSSLRWAIRYVIVGSKGEGVLAMFLERGDADDFLELICRSPGDARAYLLVDESIGEVVTRRDVEAAR